MSSEKKSKRQQRREKIYQQEMQRRLLTIGLVTVGAALLVIAVVAPQFKSIGEIITVTPHSLPNPDGTSLGDPNAPVTVDIFEDFQCPACQYFTESIEPLIIQNFVVPGKVYYVFHQYPFIDGAGARNGGESDQAANASMCANEQDRFWDMQAIIFANWNGENQGNLNNRRLQAMAESLGLDMNSFNDCFNANKYEDDIQADFELGTDMGVSGTPSAFVNRQKIGQPGKIPTYEEIAAAIELAINANK